VDGKDIKSVIVVQKKLELSGEITEYTAKNPIRDCRSCKNTQMAMSYQ